MLQADILMLAALPAFAAVEAEALQQILDLAETKLFQAGEIIFRQDEPAESGFVILSGSIALDSFKNGNASLRILEPPGILGNLSMLARSTRSATAIAREPTRLLKIRRQLFHRVLTDYPHSAESMRQSLARHLRHFAQELQSIESFSSPRFHALHG